MYSQVIYV